MFFTSEIMICLCSCCWQRVHISLALFFQWLPIFFLLTKDVTGCASFCVFPGYRYHARTLDQCRCSFVYLPPQNQPKPSKANIDTQLIRNKQLRFDIMNTNHFGTFMAEQHSIVKAPLDVRIKNNHNCRSASVYIEFSIPTAPPDNAN